MSCSVIVDGFFGDTGKGKIVSYLAEADDAAICVRGGVGPNAGHTVVKNGIEYKLRMIPCGFVNEGTLELIGPGVLVDPRIVIKEIKETGIENRFGIDKNCAIIEEHHILQDKRGHLKEQVQTTGTGTGPCNAERALRVAKIVRDWPELREYIMDIPVEVNRALDNGETVILEGTQGTYISLYHGNYPYVTSKDVTASAICSDVGLGPTRVDEVILVLKSYVTRVGGGDLEGELTHEEAKERGWDEYGTVTGRQRRAAPFNYELAKRASMINGATQIALTKMDILFPGTKGLDRYEDLPKEAKSFVEKVQEEIGLPVTLIGTGPGVKEIIDRR